MHEHGAPSGRRHSASSSSTSGSPRSSGTKLDPDSGSGRGSSRRQASRGGAGRSGRGSPLASSSHHSQQFASASAAAQSAVDAAAVAEQLSPRATASAAAAVHLPPPASDGPADRTPHDAAAQPPSGQRASRLSLQVARMKEALAPAVEFMQTLAKNARDPVAVGDAMLWLLLLPLEAMRRTARSPGAVALLRVTLEATAELLVAAMLAGAAICVTALHVMTEQDEGADGDSDKRTEPSLRLPPCCHSLQPEPPLPVDAGGERVSPRSVLSTPLPSSLH